MCGDGRQASATGIAASAMVLPALASITASLPAAASLVISPCGAELQAAQNRIHVRRPITLFISARARDGASRNARAASIALDGRASCALAITSWGERRGGGEE